jgi:uncharacterized paraquat-inducible protein A
MNAASSLTHCLRCGSEISNRALFCPNCHVLGIAARGVTKITRAIAVLVIAAAFIAGFFAETNLTPFMDKFINFLEGFIAGIGLVVLLAPRKNKE